MNNPQKDKGLWGIIERFKTIAELIATLIVVIPILFVLIQSGLTATVPIWLVLIIALFAVFLGYLFGRNPYITTGVAIKSVEQQPRPRIALQTPLQKLSPAECTRHMHGLVKHEIGIYGGQLQVESRKMTFLQWSHSRKSVLITKILP